MGKIDFFSEKLGLGKIDFTPSVILENQSPLYVYTEKVNENGQVYILSNRNEKYFDDIVINKIDSGFIAKRTFINKSDVTIKVKELAINISGIDFGAQPKDDYFYSIENPRIYEAFTFPVDYKRTSDDAANSEFDVVAGNRWADPGVIQDRINASPYQPFPAILLSNYKVKKGLVHGTLLQDVFFHNYLVYHKNKLEVDIFSSFKGVDCREVKPDEALIDEWYLGTTDEADDIEKIFTKYADILREKLPCMYGKSNINRDNMVWGSWNDGIWRNVSEDLLVEESKALKKHFPMVKWIQLDDGYSVAFNKIAHGLGVAYEGDEGINGNKFPNGLKSVTDKIRGIGLRPAIWIGGFCPHESKIYTEHPEWFIDYSYRTDATSPLDVSQPVVREYMQKALDKLVVEYGFDGVKHDFWSYAFEDSHDMFKYKDKSGYEYRKWWTQEMRKRISKDGHFQTGCDIVMGNVFLGENFSNYRYGVDVGSGAWFCMKACFIWGPACFALHTGDMFVANSDAIGPLSPLTFEEFLLWTTFVVITRSGVELAGRFSKEENTKGERFEILKKATCNPNNGADVYFAKFDYRKPGGISPEIMYSKLPLFTNQSGDALPVRTVALFNIEEKQKKVSFNLKDLGLEEGKYILIDAWTGKRLKFNGEYCKTLKRHSCQMITISKKTKYSILDANVKMLNVAKNSNVISFNSDYESQAKITLTTKPQTIVINDKESAFKWEDNVAQLFIPEKSKVKIIF